ncbi:hypothetical protein EJ08DRAFT_485747 [Tothia fuscella]|uniref:Uncharacterized protein n=1 Tax=Tothia fuscella TaxID=1048955 RepID=A0A9P4TT76_9PEZI|nr:hypothetical protein EJ08DRAFT_485747 [Tothia fuscella]
MPTIATHSSSRSSNSTSRLASSVAPPPQTQQTTPVAHENLGHLRSSYSVLMQALRTPHNETAQTSRNFPIASYSAFGVACQSHASPTRQKAPILEALYSPTSTSGRNQIPATSRSSSAGLSPVDRWSTTGERRLQAQLHPSSNPFNDCMNSPARTSNTNTSSLTPVYTHQSSLNSTSSTFLIDDGPDSEGREIRTLLRGIDDQSYRMTRRKEARMHQVHFSEIA